MENVQNTDWQEMPPTQEESSKPFQELNLIDDYMFDIATLDIEVCKDIVELAMNIRIRDIRWKEGQKVIHNLPGKRGIRLDFYIEDVNGEIFNVEMQIRNVGNLPKRTRFYKSLIDSPILKAGEKGFDNLPPTYIIFICGFDPFGYGKYRYTFQNRCKEVPELMLEDDCTTIFLSTKGNNDQEVESALVDFLKFVKNSTKEVAESSEDARIQYIYKKIESLKQQAEMEADYMKMEERDRLMREEAEMRGKKMGEEIGEYNKLKFLVSRKEAKGYTVEEIADMLEEDVDSIQKIMLELEQEE